VIFRYNISRLELALDSR